MLGLTRALAVEWGGRGVRVNAVCPGYVRTPLTEAALDARILVEQDIIDRSALDRIPLADDVARTVLFFASPDSEGVTAESVFVDCRYSLYGLPSPGLTRRRRRGA